jgi:hypothetical protein
MDEVRRKRLLWGMLLAWAPGIPLIIGPFNNFKEFSREKATGVAAVVGGMAEIYGTTGPVLTFLLEVAAIIFLARALSGAAWSGSAVSVISIAFSGFMITLAGLFLCRVMFTPYHPEHNASKVTALTGGLPLQTTTSS